MAGAEKGGKGVSVALQSRQATAVVTPMDRGPSGIEPSVHEPSSNGSRARGAGAAPLHPRFRHTVNSVTLITTQSATNLLTLPSRPVGPALLLRSLQKLLGPRSSAAGLACASSCWSPPTRRLGLAPSSLGQPLSSPATPPHTGLVRADDAFAGGHKNLCVVKPHARRLLLVPRRDLLRVRLRRVYALNRHARHARFRASSLRRITKDIEE